MLKQITGRYLRPRPAAQYLGIGVSLFWLLVKKGEIRTVKFSERVTLVDVNDLDALVAKRAA